MWRHTGTGEKSMLVNVFIVELVTDTHVNNQLVTWDDMKPTITFEPKSEELRINTLQ